ncbi:MAG: YeeE/YedE family protein [Vicinamibacterales bacterium]
MLDALFPFGWAHYLAGGLLIGCGVSLLFLTTGLIGGASTVYSSSWSYLSRHPFFQQARLAGSRDWRLVYALGMVVGAWVWWQLFGPDTGFQTSLTWWQLLGGGFLVGFGARLSNGCTSGHGICGLASLQLPSLLAVLVFLSVAIGVAHVVPMLGGL